MLATRLEIFFDIFLFLLAILCLRNSLKPPFYAPKTSRFVAFISILLFCLFAYWGGDYFHYEEGFEIVKSNPWDSQNFEDVYLFIIKISPSYLFFRLIVWGGALGVFLYIIKKKTQLSVSLAILMFTAFSIVKISYARASLCMALIWLGMSVANQSDRFKTKNFFWGLTILFVSYFFHRSAPYGILIAFVSILLARINSKRTIVLIMLSFPVIVYVVSMFLTQVMMMNVDPEDSILSLQVGQKYMGRDERAVGWGGQIRDIGEMVPYYMSLLLGIMVLLKEKKDQLTFVEKTFTYSLVLIVISATVFAFDLNFNTQLLYHRYMRFGLIPMSVFVTICYQKGLYPKYCKAIFYTGLTVSLIFLFFAFTHA